jgi:protein gp37
MSDKSAIEWTDATWNPTTGCTKVSPGCANCYIESTTPFRVQGRKFVSGHIPMKLHEGRLEQPLRWKKPKRVFVNSLSDLFHDEVPDSFIDQVFAVMAAAHRHTFQLLTKRPARMLSYLSDPAVEERIHWASLPLYGHTEDFDATVDSWVFGRWPLPNVWLGVSVENQHFADERIPLLLQTPAAVRFISAEPLIENILLEDEYALPGDHFNGIDWVIVGGESGPKSREFDVAWARSIVAQCKAAGVACFVKQLGAHPVGWWSNSLGPRVGKFKNAKGGDMAEWPTDLRVREFPEARA